jgi:hypothetical protein
MRVSKKEREAAPWRLALIRLESREFQATTSLYVKETRAQKALIRCAPHQGSPTMNCYPQEQQTHITEVNPVCL